MDKLTPTQARTLNSALAYMAITQGSKGLHYKTMSAMGGLYEHATSDHFKRTRQWFIFSVQAWERIRRSALWQAHEYMLKQGYVLDNRCKMRPHQLSYVSTADVRREGFITRKGEAWTRGPIPEAPPYPRMQKTASFRDMPDPVFTDKERQVGAKLAEFPGRWQDFNIEAMGLATQEMIRKRAAEI